MAQVLHMRVGKPVIPMDQWISVLNRANESEFNGIYEQVLNALEIDPRWTKYVKVAEEIGRSRGIFRERAVN